MDLTTLNSLSACETDETLRRCCGSTEWARQMAERRPFRNRGELCAVAAEIWRGLNRIDWLEAFAAHPRIGDIDALRRRFATTGSWAAEEQAGTAVATESTLQALSDGNRAYEARFGHIFIVCATDKSAEEMLAILRRRLGNEPEVELREAAWEQEQITRLRLERLCP